MTQPQREERGLVKYQARDGSDITLSFDTVRRYLVQGDRDKVTEQEIMYFLGICKARGLNPFKKDCYFIKYGGDPAAIVTSIDYFRSRAKAQKDCKGWQAGVIVRKKDGSLRDSEGIVLEDEQLVGGWFEAQPEGWNVRRRLEVNLRGYIKKTREGKITRFWQEDNQPTMIAKVAEGQGLRMCWPDEFEKLYTEEEIAAEQPPIDIVPEPKDENFKTTDIELEFDATLKAALERTTLKRVVEGDLNEFIRRICEDQETTAEEVKQNAIRNMDLFLSSFQRWKTASEKKETPNKDKPSWFRAKQAGFEEAYESMTKDRFETLDENLQMHWKAKCSHFKLPWPKEPPQTLKKESEPVDAGEPPWEEEKTSSGQEEPLPDLAAMEARLEQECATAYANKGTPAFLVRARKIWWTKFRTPPDPDGFVNELPTLTFDHISKWWDTRTAEEQQQIIEALDDIQL